MTPSGPVRLRLFVGPAVPAPAPRAALDAFQSAEVTIDTAGPSGFQLRFGMERDSPLVPLFMIAAGAPLPFLRVIVAVEIAGATGVLIDGLATRHEVGTSGGAPVLSVSGDDLTRAMDWIDISGLPFPAMPPEARVLMLLAKYAPLGVIPIVIPTLAPVLDLPIEHIPRQSGTDLAYMRALAEGAGYVFYLDPGPEIGMTRAYWGPEVRLGTPQKALTLEPYPFANVRALRFGLRNEGRSLPFVFIQERNSRVTIPVPIPDISPLRPPLGAVKPPPTSFEQLNDVAHLSIPEALMRGIGRAQASADVMEASGSLDPLRYGGLLRARGLVGVRGAGLAFDGLWYVKKVTTRIQPGAVVQDFDLARDGLMPTVAKVAA